jgi:hypothetical protein
MKNASGYYQYGDTKHETIAGVNPKERSPSEQSQSAGKKQGNKDTF